MPVSDVLPLVTFTADGISTSFPFAFRIFLETDLIVSVDGTPVVLGTDYGVTMASSGGSVDFVPARKPAAGQKVNIIRLIPLDRRISYQDTGGFHSLTVDEDLDRVVMMVQDQHLNVEDQGNRLTLMESQIATAVSNFSTVIVTNGAGSAATVITPSASLGPMTVDLVGLSEVVVSREDDSGNELKILDSSGATVLRQEYITLDVQDESVHLRKIVNNWKKI